MIQRRWNKYFVSICHTSIGKYVSSIGRLLSFRSLVEIHESRSIQMVVTWEDPTDDIIIRDCRMSAKEYL